MKNHDKPHLPFLGRSFLFPFLNLTALRENDHTLIDIVYIFSSRGKLPSYHCCYYISIKPFDKWSTDSLNFFQKLKCVKPFGNLSTGWLK